MLYNNYCMHKFEKNDRKVTLLEERDEIIISPKVIFEVLRKNIIFLVAVTMVFAIGSYVYTKVFVTKLYTSTLSMYVEINYATQDGDDNTKIVQSINETTLARRMVSTCVKLLDTNTFYTTLSDRLGNDYSPSQLKGMITYRVDDEKTIEIFDVLFVSSSPIESKRIADAFAEVSPKRISDMNTKISLKVADPGQVPSGPSSPHTAKNVFIATAVGLALALIVAFVRHFLDKKIKYSDEMTEIYNIPVLAAIPNFDSYVQKANDGKRGK